LKNIPRESKVLSVSHNDWDGCYSQIILGNVYSDIQYLNVSFYKIDSIMESIEYHKYDFVFLTDINPTNIKLLDLSDNIILLDHHESAIESNNPSKMHYVIPGQCAAKLTLRFVEKYYKIKLPYLYDHCEMVNDYDLWILKNPESKKLNDLMFYHYRPRKFRELFFDGRTTFNDEEKEWLEMREKEFERRYKALTVFDCDKINGCVVQSDEFINEICDKLMKEEGYEIIFCRNPVHGRVSIRHKIEGLNVGEILKNLGFGGGHRDSAGLFCESINQFQERLEILENVIVSFINTHKMVGTSGHSVSYP